MGKTKIEWATHSWPVVTGCSPVSSGCTNCYAARMAATRLKHHPRYAGLATIHKGKPKWTGLVHLNNDVLEQPLHWHKPALIFVASMGDLFHENVPAGFIYDVFRIMGIAKQHTFQILTKRPRRMRDFINAWSGGQIFAKASFSKLHPNIWLGISAENQATADECREYLRQCPAAVRFVSYEPALGPIDWAGWEFVDQIISGGESGPGARPSHPDWYRATRDFCQEHNIAYFFKQWGAWTHIPSDTRYPLLAKLHWWPDRNLMGRVGKKAAGRLLDGVEWNQMPSRNVTRATIGTARR